MSKLTDALNVMRVFNNHELILRFGSGRDVAAEYCQPEARSVRPPMTVVYSPRFRADPSESWYGGAKIFTGNRDASLPKALAWASNEFGIAEWAVSPFGGRIPAHVLKAAKAAVKAVA